MTRISRVTLSSAAFLILTFAAFAQAVPLIATAENGETADDYDEYATEGVYDPIEGFNRRVFAFNDWTYVHVLIPATKGYEWVVRPPVNRAISNFYTNLRYPVRLVNALLQGKFSRADLETRKFVVNTLGGLGGFIRQSDNVPLLAELPSEDFGQTLGVWGVPRGPYVVVPLFGGYTVRDMVGRAGDAAVSPTGWEYFGIPDGKTLSALSWEWKLTINVTEAMSSLPDDLALYQQVKSSAIDPYTSVRDATRRYRDHQTEQ